MRLIRPESSAAMERLGFLVACVLFLLAPSTVAAGQTDPQPAWPLCGRISANPPVGWTESQGCPAVRFGNAAYSDQPLSSTYGPRPLYSGDNRYDFHRGVDIAAPLGTPVFAIADGLVQIAGDDPGYTDPLIKLRHFRPGQASCASVGCYYSLYLHVSDWVVPVGTTVTKGQLLGHTGASSASNFAHLHFEVRDAPASDTASAWSRDAVHPLRVLPYSVANNSSVVFGAVDTGNANATVAQVTVSSNRYDLQSVEMRVFDASHVEIAQPGNTPDARGYYVTPPFFDMETSNFQYSHKDSATFPWESYGAGGVNECPYASEHGAAYDGNVHMDAQSPTDFHQGLFNGVLVSTRKYWPSDVADYWLQLEFQALRGPAACIEATAVFVGAASQTGKWGACTPPPPSPITMTLAANNRGTAVTVRWTGATGAKVDVRRDGALLASPKNIGSYTDKLVVKGASYTYRVCQAGSTTACSSEASITL